MKTHPLIRVTTVAAFVILLFFKPVAHATDLLVNTRTNFLTKTVGTQNFHKYDADVLSLSPDGSTAPTDPPRQYLDYTYAITLGNSDPDAVDVNRYTTVLKSAQPGYITETYASSMRPTGPYAGPNSENFYDWDTYFAQDFNYHILGEGACAICNGAASYKIWLITVKIQAVLTLPRQVRFGTKRVRSKTKRNFIISNNGNVPLTVTSITYPVGFRGAWAGTIQPSTSQVVTVTFRPTRVKRYAGKITINSDATSGYNKVPVIGFGR